MQVQQAGGIGTINGGGEMGERIRATDWRTSRLGTPDTWPQALRLSVNILLNSQFPMFVWWGPELITIYNDAYIPIAGEKHPVLLGQSGRDAWAEIWDVVGPMADQVMLEGISNWAEDQVLYMNRHGYLEETYFTFSYSPIFSETGSIDGLFCACTETTEKVFAARRIQESEQNLRTTILQSPVAMCILKGPAFVVEIANNRMYEIWGRSADKLFQKPIFDGLPEARAQGLEELLHQVYTTGKTFSASEHPIMLPRDGAIETVYVNFVYEPFRDGDGQVSGVIVVANEITELVMARKKIEESERELQMRVQERTSELEAQKTLLDNILTNSSNGISVTEMIRNSAGEVVDAATILANDAAVKYIGLPREIYLSKTAVELDPNILRSPYGQTCLNTLQTGEPAIMQYFLEISSRWLELTISKMDNDHLIHIFTDVTPIKEAQLQLEQTIDELQRSNANLEEFAYAASHDMKEPIRKIHFFSDRLRVKLANQMDAEATALFGRMQLATERMNTLIEDLLQYSHISRGISSFEQIDLNKKVKLVLEDLELEILEKGASISVGSLPQVRGHRRQLQQMFQNLISNALKYSKPGVAPEIQITSRLVHASQLPFHQLKQGASETVHLIEVKDNGIGFEQQDADRIFHMFTRLHASATYRGTGIGLSIVKKVVENHAGFIEAQGEPGNGATFKIYLPA